MSTCAAESILDVEESLVLGYQDLRITVVEQETDEVCESLFDPGTIFFEVL